MITILAAALLTPSATSMPRTINRDGVSATYTRSVDANGTVHLQGRYHGGGDKFHYQIRGRKVEGRVGNAKVAFALPAR